VVKTLIFVAMGGALGASVRFLLSAAALRLLGPQFPWGTLAANLIGSFLMGLLIGALVTRIDLSDHLRAFFSVGVLGGFTTFSAFSLELANMIERGDLSLAGLYALTSLILGVTALFAGLAVARTLWPEVAG